jgi:hypothetical protein
MERDTYTDRPFDWMNRTPPEVPGKLSEAALLLLTKLLHYTRESRPLLLGVDCGHAIITY